MKMILMAFIKVAQFLISLVFAPIDLIIEANLPGVSAALTKVSSMLSYLIPFARWVLSWLPFTVDFYVFCISALLFIYMVPVLVNALKVVVKWWHALVP